MNRLISCGDDDVDRYSFCINGGIGVKGEEVWMQLVLRIKIADGGVAG
jgi:hypothetical protein